MKILLDFSTMTNPRDLSIALGVYLAWDWEIYVLKRSTEVNLAADLYRDGGWRTRPVSFVNYNDFLRYLKDTKLQGTRDKSIISCFLEMAPFDPRNILVASRILHAAKDRGYISLIEESDHSGSLTREILGFSNPSLKNTKKINWDNYTPVDDAVYSGKARTRGLIEMPGEIVNLDSKGGDLYDLSTAISENLSFSTPCPEQLPSITKIMKLNNFSCEDTEQIRFEVITPQFASWAEAAFNIPSDEIDLFERLKEEQLSKSIQIKIDLERAKETKRHLILAPLFATASVLTHHISCLIEMTYAFFRYLDSKHKEK